MGLKRLFLVDGAAGTGKSDLLHIAQHDLEGRVCILTKYTSAPRRAGPKPTKRSSKDNDLKFVTREEMKRIKKSHNSNAYSYFYPKNGGEEYLLLRSEIEEGLSENDNLFVVIRSAKVIKEIIADFPAVEVIPLFVYALKDNTVTRLKAEGFDKNEIDFAMTRGENAISDYYNYPTLYRAVLINDSNKDIFRKLVIEFYKARSDDSRNHLVISAAEKFYLPSFLQPHALRISKALVSTCYEKNVFVMMEFDRSADKHSHQLCNAISAKGYNPVRADAPDWNLTGDIYNPYAVLFCCKFGVALFGAKKVPDRSRTYNINVAIEAAAMILQDKKCLVLKHKSLAAPPFDLTSRLHEEYDELRELKSKVERWLSQVHN